MKKKNLQKKIRKKIIKSGFIGRFKMPILNFNFVTIYIIHKMKFN